MAETARVALPPKLIPIFQGEADVRGAYGGRGSGKTRSFAKMSAVRAYAMSRAGLDGVILCGRQYMNSLDESSLEEIKGAVRSEPWLMPHFDIGEKYVRTLDGRISYAFAGLDRSISSIKSKAKIRLCWVDEAEPVTESAWETLLPTIREEGSELWVTWNPERDGSPTDQRFRKSSNPMMKVVEMNWRDNPKFPAKLERQRQSDKQERPDSYEHVWEGAYKTSQKGSYYAQLLAQARRQGRIGVIPYDPLMTFRAYVDIGGTGARADAFAMWFVQHVGREIRVLDYYEAVGQPIGAHLGWMRLHDYTPANTQFWLPHDGANHDKVQQVTYESALKDAGFRVTVVANQGAGAAAQRIEAVRRFLPRMYFHEQTTEPGLKALAWYHEKWDEKRNVGLGPNHDWSSHAADAIGLMAITYTEPQPAPRATATPFTAYDPAFGA